MELNKHNVMIVSAFGRGNWLAAELAQQGLTVSLVDLSSQLGVWPVEDAEGPFGYFSLERYANSFRERMAYDDPYQSVDHGLTFWLQDGPLEMKSSLTKFRLNKLGFSETLYEDLILGTDLNPKTVEKYRQMSFSKNWPVALSMQLAATTYLPSAKAMELGRAIPLMHEFHVRSATRSGQEKSLNWLREKNVQVSDKTKVVDLALDGRKAISGAELQGEFSGLIKVDQIVWMLNSEDTYYISEKIGQFIYPKGKIESEWCWIRFRLKFAHCPELERLPLHSILIQELGWPWTHENLVILQRTPAQEQIDAWIRIPTVQRFNKDYLKHHGDEVCKILRQRMPLSEPVVQTYPQEYYYTYRDLGAPRVPVYSLMAADQRNKQVFSNVYLDSEEIWKNRTIDCLYDAQSEIKNKIMNWWSLQQQKKSGKDLES